VIDWEINKASVASVGLAHILKELKHQINNFEWLSFHHIYRELNEVADKISKEALLLPKGSFIYYENVEGKVTKEMEFQL